MIDQGYLIYANNNSKCNYVRQAYALALSIKLYNKDAHITVVTENEINEQYKKVFDDIIVPRESPVSQSVLNAEQRCHAFNISPYLKTIVLDADMLVTENLDTWWKHLENYMLGEERPNGNNFVYKLAKDMSEVVIEKGLVNINEIWGSEISLYYPDLYAGTTDLVGVHNGTPAIMDYKSTTRPKKEEWVEDYYLQCCAYALAHNELYETNINKVVIIMCSREKQYQEFICEGEKFEDKCQKWTERLEEYYK